MKKNILIILLLQLFIIGEIFPSEREIIKNLKFSLLDVNTRDTSFSLKNTDVKKKSISKALLLSFFVPGLGEKYVGNNKLSKYIIISEISLWGLYIYHNVYSNWIEDDYKLFAVEHANINSSGKDKRYFVNIGNFSDIFGYNNKKRLDREDNLVYNEISSYYWKWDSDENKKKFKSMRIKSDTYNNRLSYFVAGIFLNHLISSINSAISAKNYNKSIHSSSNLKFQLGFYPMNDCNDIVMKLKLKYQF